MKHFQAAKIQNWSVMLVLTGILALISVVMGSFAQDLELKYVIMMIGIVGAWLVYSLFGGVSLHGSLILISLALIKPLMPVFFLLLLLFIFLIIAEMYHKEQLSLHLPYPVASLMILAFGAYSALRISDPLGYTMLFTTVIVPVLTLILCRNARLDETSMLIWMKAIVAVGAFVGAYGIYIAIQNPFERLGSFWFTAMTINGFYTMAFFFALTLLFQSTTQFLKALYAFAALLILFGMLYTYTRMAILAVAFGIFLFMIRIRSMRYLGIVFVALMPLVIPSSMISRIELGFNNDVSLLIRGIAWYLAGLQIYHNPLTGIGFGVWTEWYPSMIPMRQLYAQHPHNLYLNLMVEMGIIAALSYLWIIYSVLRRYWKSHVAHTNDILHYGMWVSLMAVMFACITDIFIQQHLVSIMFWLSLGIVLRLTDMRESHE
jgi:O-antigen ligase